MEMAHPMQTNSFSLCVCLEWKEFLKSDLFFTFNIICLILMADLVQSPSSQERCPAGTPLCLLNHKLI